MESKFVRMRTNTMTGIALMAALMCIIGPMSIPIGLVPITLTNLVIYIAAYLLGGKNATISYIVYLLLGIFGLPVFSGYTGGIAKLSGPTGGYLVGFIFMALLSGYICGKFRYHIIKSFIGLGIATLVAYAFGTVWFKIQANCTFAYAFNICVLPFLIGDVVKISAATIIGPLIRKQLARSNLLH